MIGGTINQSNDEINYLNHLKTRYSLYQVNAFFIFWGWQLMGFSAFMYIYVNITEQCAQVSSHFLSLQINVTIQRSNWLLAALTF